MVDGQPPSIVPAKRLRAAHFGLALVWSLAAIPLVAWLLHVRDPESAVRTALIAAKWLRRGTVAVGVIAAVALLAYPPFPAWLRLMWHRTKIAFTTDRGPLMRALGELRHFESAARQLEVGRQALQLGDAATAGQHLSRAVELDPSLAAAWYQWGRFLFGQHALAEALDAFTRAESAESGHAFGDALLHAGRCLHLLGKDQQAVGVLREHARRHGGGRRSSYWLAEALLAAGDRDAARAAFAAAAAPAKERLVPEENWFRALARVRLWRLGGRP